MRPLPTLLSREPHFPGRTARPPDAWFDPLKAALSSDMAPEALAESQAFLGGLEAFSHRYYWEAHELLEAVWMCLPPASAERHLLRGLIQLANGGLKARMGRAAAVSRILALADTALAEAFLNSREALMGLGPEGLADLRAQVIGETAESDCAK